VQGELNSNNIIKEAMAAEFNYEEMCAALLCLFFSASLNDSICLNF
jgi:hypothetical protein